MSKSHVANVLRQATAEIVRMRQEGKHRVPRVMPINRVWAMDLTGKADLTGRQRMMLGVLDHGSRACLRLTALNDKRSLTILRELLVTFRRFRLPRRIRVDNEACFNARLMKVVLRGLGIRLQTTALHCPWQNGRIERFFGTLKQRLDRIAVVDGHDLRVKLVEFRAWYNHARPHQHLDGHTPAEVWDGRAKSIKRSRCVRVWNGHISGWFFPP
ncbi:MAG: integrase core domain-containing protein [Rhodanobacter sp.]|nr:integrase core domain-containing protein [Rhodanobacter sp.]